MEQNILLTQLSLNELGGFIEDSVRKAFKECSILPLEPQNNKDLLSINEASIHLNLAIPTLYGLVSNGSIPYMKKGKKLYFSKLELTDWIKSGRRKTSAEKKDEINALLIKTKKSKKSS